MEKILGFMGYMNKKIGFCIIGSYIILTIIFTYPVAFVRDKIPGFSHMDSGQFLWVLWWFKKALFELSNPYYSTYIFYPKGVSLAFSTVTPYNAILSIPLQSIFGLIQTYNILWLLSFIMAGYGMYLLTKYMTNDTRASFVSGLIFMFSPYHFSRGLPGHLNLLTIQWIPFYILYLYKTVKEDDTRNSLYAGFFLLLVALSEYQYLIFTIIFTIFFIIYYNKDILKRNIIKRLLVMIIFFGLTFFPFIYPILREIVKQPNYIYSGGFEKYSADLIGFFIPTHHPIFGNHGQIHYGFFVGYTVLLLTFIAILKIKTKEIRFWSLSTIIFFILALGPKLHINGKLLDFPLPYSILTDIPIFSIARAPSRWYILVMLSIAILACYGLSYLFKKDYTNKNYRNYLMIIISGLIIFEYLSIPYPMTDAKIPEFYYQLKNNSEDVSILELPATENGFIADYMYYQTLHEKKMVDGYVSRRPPYTKIFEKNPFINQLFLLSGDMVISDNTAEYGKSILNYYNIRYIILHEKYMNRDQINIANNLLKNISIEKLIYKEDQLIVYKVEKTKPKSFILLDNFEIENRIWMSNNATFLSYSTEIRYSNLSLQLRSFYKPRLLQVYLNDKLIRQEFINTSLNKLELELKLEKGENIIKLYSPDKCQRPIDFPELKNENKNCLSIMLTNISSDNFELTK